MDTYYRIGQPFGVAPLLGDWQEWGCKGEAAGECGVKTEDSVKFTGEEIMSINY